MIKNFILEYWIDDNWYIGKLKEIPGVFSQGKTLEELEENIREVYSLMLEDQVLPHTKIHTKEMGIEV